MPCALRAESTRFYALCVYGIYGVFDYFEVDLPLYGIYPILIKKGGARARKLRPAEAGADHLACCFNPVPLGFVPSASLVRLIQQKPALRSHPLSEKSMNPGAIKIG